MVPSDVSSKKGGRRNEIEVYSSIPPRNEADTFSLVFTSTGLAIIDDMAQDVPAEQAPGLADEMI